MHQALLQYPDVSYELCSTLDGYQCVVSRYPSMDDLLSAIGDFSTVLLFLRDNYTSWILILDGVEALFIGCAEQGSTIANGAIASMNEWLYKVTVDCPRKSRGHIARAIRGRLLKTPAYNLMLAYLQDLRPELHQLDHQKMFPALTYYGSPYWYRFIPAKQDCPQ